MQTPDTANSTPLQGDTNIHALVRLLTKNYGEHPEIIRIGAKHQISKAAVLDVVAQLQRLIFPGYFGNKTLQNDVIEYYLGELLEHLVYTLQKQLGRALRSPDKSEEDTANAAKNITYAFLERLPDIRKTLVTDVSSTFDGDPSAFSKDEIILSYPGIYAIMIYRAAHELYKLGTPHIPRMMSEYAHSETGIDIHPGATIGHHFFIDHGTGIVIGETTVIGNYVKIYQGVTLGALSTRGGQFLSGVKRHPTIEDHVTIYAGASILGGETVIGEGVVIGSNVFITKSVPEKTRVSVKNPELQFMQHNASVEFVQDFVI